jgi:hypothetical protein
MMLRRNRNDPVGAAMRMSAHGEIDTSAGE